MIQFFKHITVFLLLGASNLIAQNVTTSSKEVDIALQFGSEGNYEESIKKSLQLLSSDIELSLKDSFRIYHSLAYNVYYIGDYENALNYAKKAFYLDSRINTPQATENVYLTMYFNAAEQYDSSIYYLKNNAKNLPKNDLGKYALAKTNNNIGFTYYLAGEYDSAKIYYEKVTNNKYIEENHQDIFGLATGNLGQLHFENKDYKNALIKMTIDAELTKHIIPESYNNALLGIAEIHLILKEYSQALSALNKFLKNGKKGAGTTMRGYKLIAEVLQKSNSHKESAKYFSKYITISDSVKQFEKPNKELVKQLSRTRVSLIEKDLTIAKKEVALIDSELELSQNIANSESLKKTIYLILFSLSVLIAIASIFYFKNRQKKNLKIHKLENELISAELKNKKSDLNNVVTNLSYKRKFIDQIQEKLKELKNQPSEKIAESITLLIREFNSYKSVDQNMKVLQTDIEKVNLSFFKTLGEKFPLLTENEKELCGLLLLKLSSKDIANIRNITPNAVKKARQRIRKKLPIAQDQKITTFLESV